LSGRRIWNTIAEVAMKRVTSWSAVALCLVMLPLVGCGGGSDDPESPRDVPTPVPCPQVYPRCV
jgi:hypothetical protein